MRRTILRILVTGLALGLLAGCGGLPVGRADRAILLDGAVNNYRKLIRWGYYDEAAKYLRETDGRAITADLKNAAKFRVTNYTVSSQIMDDTGKEARVVATIEYYELDAGVIHTLHDEQVWWYDAKEKRWYLNAALPRFGQPEEADDAADDKRTPPAPAATPAK